MKKVCSVFIVLFLFITQGFLFGTTRVVGVYPGTMWKMPTSTKDRSPYLFRTGFTTEVHRFSDPFNTSRGFFMTADISENFSLGFSSVQGADTTALELISESTYTPPIEFGLHLQQRVYRYNDVSFSIGIHDVVFKNDEASGLTLDPKDFSLFVAIGSEKLIGDYKLSTFLGFGSGGFGAGSTVVTDTTSTSGTKAGVFAGFLLNTSFFAKNSGGIDIVGEFDGSGINVGLRIPLTSDYRLSVGFTHIENLPDFSATQYSTAHPGIFFGLDMAVARGQKAQPTSSVPMVGRIGPDLAKGAPEQVLVDSALSAANKSIAVLRDSIRVNDIQMRNLMTQVSSLQQKSVVLEDSLKTFSLEKAVSQKNMNRAMRHLSLSLRYFYSGDYREALQEVETSLDLNPNLAIAYARRGSIYFKLGDVQRATINWNLALQIDPEYEDVRNILKALHEDRLRTTGFAKD